LTSSADEGRPSKASVQEDHRYGSGFWLAAELLATGLRDLVTIETCRSVADRLIFGARRVAGRDHAGVGVRAI
jgi:hypothetical protein